LELFITFNPGKWSFLMKNHKPAFESLVNDAKTRIKEISIDRVKERLDNNEKFTLIDVREDKEWEKGHIPSARHISKGIIERDIETLIPDKSQEIILYCGGGYRSALVCDNLQKMGYTSAYSMKGGIRSWNASRYEITN
jgi:rhodanese-related sulfurtransferase